MYSRLAEGNAGPPDQPSNPLQSFCRQDPRGGSRSSVPAELDQLWDHIRNELRRETPDFKFHIWLEPLELAGRPTASTLYVRAPDHMRTWVAERYLPLLRQAAGTGFDRARDVEIVGTRMVASRRGARARRAQSSHGDGLNPKYTFEQFVIGEGNRFAHAAALAVAELPAPGLQPALPPRPARARQDAPAPRDRQLRPALRRRAARPLRDRRGVHERRSSTPSASGDTGLSRSASAAPTSCCSTTSSSSPTRPRPRRSSSTPSTRCSTPGASS